MFEKIPVWKFNMTKFYRFGRAVCNLFCHFWFKMDINGLENLPDSGGYILVSNHKTYFDPLFVGIKLKRQLNFMAKQELFQVKVLGPIIRRLGAFPVSRGTGDTSAIDKAVSTVENGDILALFPEGTRSKTMEIMRFKSGAIVVASQTGADIVPTCIYLTKGTKFRSRVVVRYGTIIRNGELSIDPQNLRTIKAASNLVRNAVCELYEKAREQYPCRELQ